MRGGWQPGSFHSDRFHRRHPQVVLSAPSPSMHVRSAIDTSRATGYVCDYLERVEILNENYLTAASPEHFAQIPFVATEESDYSSAFHHKSISQEEAQSRLMGSVDRSDEDDDETFHQSNFKSAPDYQFNTNMSLSYVLLRGHLDSKKTPQHHNCCLARIQSGVEAMLHNWKKETVAKVSYNLNGNRFTHDICFLSCSGGGNEVSRNLNECVARVAEWVMPKKTESPTGPDFSLHTFRIALSLARDMIHASAAQEMYCLEQKETTEFMIRILEMDEKKVRLKALIDQKSSENAKLELHETRLRAKLAEGGKYVTANEQEQMAAGIRDEIDKATSLVRRRSLKIDEKIQEVEREIESLKRRKRLRETSETHWAFQVFEDKNGGGNMYTPSLRTGLLALETHPTMAMVNESLWRLGKQSNVVLFETSVVPYKTMDLEFDGCD